MSDSRELQILLRARDEASKVIDGAIGKLKGVGRNLTTAGTALTMAVTAPILAVGAVSVKTFADVEKGMNEVFTLMPGISEEAMGAMTDDVLAFSKEFGVLPTKTIPALYQALSAGIPSENVFTFMETAQKAALGGVTDLETAVDGISSAVNAFKAQGLTATEASDAMFTAVRLGKTTFDELSKSLFNVSPIAAAAGVKFSDVTAAIATMTAQGVPTSVVTTQLRQMMVELTKEGGAAAVTFEQLAGQSFKEFIASGGDVADALLIMQDGAVASGVGINDLFSSVEAGSAALALTGANLDGFVSNMDAMAESAGATDAAYAQMDQGISRSMDKLKATLSVSAVKIGAALAPLIEKAMPYVERFADKIVELADRFSNLDPRLQKLIIGAIGLVAALGPVLLIVGKVIGIITALAPVIGMIGPAFAALMGPIGLVVIAIAAIIAIVILCIKYHKEIKAALIAAWNAIKDAMSAVWNWIKGTAEKVWNAIKDFFAQWWPLILGIMTGGIGLVAGVIYKYHEQIWAFIQKIWGAITGFFSTVWDAVGGAFTAAWDAIAGFFVTIWNWIKKVAEAIWNAITAFFRAVWGIIKAIFRGDLDAIRGIVGDKMGWIDDKIRAVWNAVKGYLAGVWDEIKAMFGRMWDGIKTVWLIAANWIKDIPGKIKAIFAGAGTWLLQIGRDVINGLWDGMKAIWNRVSGWVSSIGSKIKNAFKWALGISSPSRVMAELGINTMEGLRIGLERGMHDVLRAVDFSGVRVTYAMAGALGATGAPGFASAASSTSTHSVVNHYNITIDGSKMPSADFEGLIRSIEVAKRMVTA